MTPLPIFLDLFQSSLSTVANVINFLIRTETGNDDHMRHGAGGGWGGIEARWMVQDEKLRDKGPILGQPGVSTVNLRLINAGWLARVSQ